MFGSDAFQKETNVSRETLERFRTYASLLEIWSKKINLIGPGTGQEVWKRHFLDSAQVLPLVRKARPDLKHPSWIDIGSGAGFPGLVLSLLGEEQVTLVEPNPKKCAFLRAVIRETSSSAHVVQAKAEEISPFPVDFATSRALAPVSDIISLAHPFLKPKSEIWLLKGAKSQEELTLAGKNWNMETEIYPSRTNPTGKILRLKTVRMAGPAS